MPATPLSIGPLAAEGCIIRRSGVHWLCEDGHWCRPNEVIGFCNIVVERAPGKGAATIPFADERELQVAFATPSAGRFRLIEGQSPGGLLNVLGVRVWDPGTVLAALEDGPEAGDAGREGAPDALRSLVLAGRRMTDLADVNGGLLSGWHSRVRAWWGEGGPGPTILSLGICDLTGVIRGERAAFVEMFEVAPGAAQLVFVPDHPLAPCAPVLLEQFERTPVQMRAIEDDLKTALAQGRVAPTPEDWMFAGALLGALGRSPLRDTYDLLTPEGLVRTGPADVVLLSLTAEPNSVLVHKALGYTIHVLRHHQQAAGPAIQAWLASAFQVVRRPTEAIRESYRRLFQVVGGETGARFLVLNRMSTSGDEDVSSYSAFDAPMSDTLANIASKELNIMLHDLEDDCGISVIDVDTLAATLGGAEHLPDGIHQSGALQAALRTEIFRMSASS